MSLWNVLGKTKSKKEKRKKREKKEKKKENSKGIFLVKGEREC